MTQLSQQLEALAAKARKRLDPIGVASARLDLADAFLAHEATILAALKAQERQPDDAIVERVARALFAEQFTSDPDLPVCSWEDACEFEHEAWRQSALTALAAATPPAPEGDA